MDDTQPEDKPSAVMKFAMISVGMSILFAALAVGSEQQSVASGWDTDVQYKFDKNWLNITFKPSTNNYSHYKVVLENTMQRGLPSLKVFIETRLPRLSVSFSSKQLVNNNTYQIKIYPQRFDGTSYATAGRFICLKPFLFNAFKIQCSNWTVNTLHQVVKRGRILDVQLEIPCPDVDCFDSFEVVLWSGVDDCLGTSGHECETENSRRKIFPGSRRDSSSNTTDCAPILERLVFKNLTPGRYCERIYPNPPCPPGCVRYTKVFTIEAEEPTTPVSIASEPAEVHNKYIWWLGVVAVVPIAALITVWLIKHKCEVPVHIHTCPEAEHLEMAQTTKKVVVSLLYSHDSEFHKSAVCALARFLQNCWDIDVILDTDCQHVIFFDKESWVANMVRYPCEQRGETAFSNQEKKLIIVESEGAVKQQLGRMNGNVMDAMESSLETVFITALSAIMSDFERCTSDYCHIYVVHLNYTPTKYRLDYIVPNRRYYLPDHLTHLYKDLYGKSHCPSISTFQTFWLHHPSYIKFLQFTEPQMFHPANHTV